MSTMALNVATPPVLGIDFGTSKICSAVLIDGNAVVIENERGERKVPVYLVQDVNPDGSRSLVIGRQGRDLSTIHPSTCLFNLMSFANTSDADAEKVIADLQLPFNFIEDPKTKKGYVHCTLSPGKPKISVCMAMSEFLNDTKYQAEKAIGRRILQCVLTIPAEWEKKNNVALEYAARSVGFTNIKYEYADQAAMVGCLSQNISQDFADRGIHNYVMVDCGAAAFRTSVLYVGLNGMNSLLMGQTNLSPGGNNLDMQIMRHCAAEFVHQHNGVNMVLDYGGIHRLRLACEDAKIHLSTSTSYEFNINNLYQGKDFRYKLTLAKFEDILGPIVQELIEQIRVTIAGSNICKNGEVSFRILVLGGGSRIPLIRKLIGWAFPITFERAVLSYAEEAAAIGAAHMGSEKFGFLSVKKDKIDQYS